MLFWFLRGGVASPFGKWEMEEMGETKESCSLFFYFFILFSFIFERTSLTAAGTIQRHGEKENFESSF